MRLESGVVISHHGPVHIWQFADFRAKQRGEASQNNQRVQHKGQNRAPYKSAVPAADCPSHSVAPLRGPVLRRCGGFIILRGHLGPLAQGLHAFGHHQVIGHQPIGTHQHRIAVALGISTLPPD